jgi:alpha-dioxygenase
VIAALVAKIHTVDWTLELLKTYTLKIVSAKCISVTGSKQLRVYVSHVMMAMLALTLLTNWFGLPKASALFRLTQKKKADNKGVPFCLAEDFAAVYCLHPMLPPGVIFRLDKKEFIPLEQFVGDAGRKATRANPERFLDFWDSTLFYPCGNLVVHNYPTALHDVAPTDENGNS